MICTTRSSILSLLPRHPPPLSPLAAHAALGLKERVSAEGAYSHPAGMATRRSSDSLGLALADASATAAAAPPRASSPLPWSAQPNSSLGDHSKALGGTTASSALQHSHSGGAQNRSATSTSLHQRGASATLLLTKATFFATPPSTAAVLGSSDEAGTTASKSLPGDGTAEGWAQDGEAPAAAASISCWTRTANTLAVGAEGPMGASGAK